MSVDYSAGAVEDGKDPSPDQHAYVRAVINAIRGDAQLRAWLESKLIEGADAGVLSGVFFRRRDGVQFPFSNPCYVVELDEAGLPSRLAFYKDGFQNEVYALTDKNRAVYLAAVSQGFEPPRGLIRRDRLERSYQKGSTLDVDSIETPTEPQFDERLIQYSVAVSDDGIGLTVYEDGKACTVELSDEAATDLADLLTRRGR